jgi:hypothetical protein
MTHGKSSDVDDISTRVPVTLEGTNFLRDQFKQLDELAKQNKTDLKGVLTKLFQSANITAWHPKENRSIEKFWLPAFEKKLAQLNDSLPFQPTRVGNNPVNLPKSKCK